MNTRQLLKNIGWTSVAKILAVLGSFLGVRLMVTLLDTATYGFWITASVLLTWLNFFDFGISQGLQNKISQTIAKQDTHGSQALISSTYLLVGVMALAILFGGGILLVVGNWQHIFNASFLAQHMVRWAVAAVIVSGAVQLVLRLLAGVLFAHQLTVVTEFMYVAIQWLICMGLGLLYVSQAEDTFFWVVAVQALVPMLVWALASAWFYGQNFKNIRPRFAAINWAEIPSLLGISLHLLVMQLYGLVLFSTDSLIISHYISPSEVTLYSIANKYYTLLTIVFSMVLMPYWSGLAKMYALGNRAWIRQNLRRLLWFWGGLCLLGILLMLMANRVVYWWTGLHTALPWQLSGLMLAFTLILAYNNIYSILLNVAQYFKLNSVAAVAVIVLNVPLSIALVSYVGLGILGVVWANIICVIGFGIVVRIQAEKILGTSKK